MPIETGTDTARTRRELKVGAELCLLFDRRRDRSRAWRLSKPPASLKVVLETCCALKMAAAPSAWTIIKGLRRMGEAGGQNPREIAYRPARVLMQDFTGVPAVVDLAAMRDGIKALGGDPPRRSTC